MIRVTGCNTSAVAVEIGDLVGYVGGGSFVILNPHQDRRKKLPQRPRKFAWCFYCKIKNKQVVNFLGRVAKLGKIEGVWYYVLDGGKIIHPLEENRFFEIGDGKKDEYESTSY